MRASALFRAVAVEREGWWALRLLSVLVLRHPYGGCGASNQDAEQAVVKAPAGALEAALAQRPPPARALFVPPQPAPALRHPYGGCGASNRCWLGECRKAQAAVRTLSGTTAPLRGLGGV